MREAAKERQSEAAIRGNVSRGSHPVKAVRPRPAKQTRDDIGKTFGISGRSVERGVKVNTKGHPIQRILLRPYGLDKWNLRKNTTSRASRP